MKFIVYVTTIVFAVLGAQAQESPSTCVAVDFKQTSAEISEINNLITIGGELVEDFASFVDPLNLKSTTLSAIPFTIAGLKCELTPTIQTLTAGGISHLQLHNVSTPTSNSLQVEASVDGDAKVTTTLRLSIKQVERRPHSLCWTNLLKLKQCPGKDIDIDISLGLSKPSVAAKLQVDMLQCAQDAGSDCKDIDASQVFLGVVNMLNDSSSIKNLIVHVLRRVNKMEMVGFWIDFDKVTDLNFHFHSSDKLATVRGKKLLNFGKKQLSKKDDAYDMMMKYIEKLITAFVNKLIKDNVGSKFVGDCRDDE